MEFRQLGKSGFRVPVLCLGTATFGGRGELFKAWGTTIDQIAAETGKTIPQVALNWLLERPSVSTLIIGARNEAQLRENLQAVGWNLSPEQAAKLDAASATTLAYPYWHQRGYVERNPPPV